MAVLEAPHPLHMRASVRLKLTDGEHVGGLVWRYQDAENFYLAALDLRVQQLSLYRVVRGNRITPGSGGRARARCLRVAHRPRRAG